MVGEFKVIIAISILRLEKENNDKHAAGLLCLDNKIRDEKLSQVGLFDKRESFLFSNVRLPEK